MYYVISNPTAGKRGNKYCLELATKVFDAHGVKYEVYETTHRGEAQDIAKKLTSNGATELVVVGGDGTLHEVLNGIQNPLEPRRSAPRPESYFSDPPGKSDKLINKYRSGKNPQRTPNCTFI